MLAALRSRRWVERKNRGRDDFNVWRLLDIETDKLYVLVCRESDEKVQSNIRSLGVS